MTFQKSIRATITTAVVIRLAVTLLAGLHAAAHQDSDCPATVVPASLFVSILSFHLTHVVNVEMLVGGAIVTGMWSPVHKDRFIPTSNN